MSDARGPLHPRVFAILVLLARGPSHGYGLMKALQDDPVERWPIGPATLYRTLQEMEAEGLIEDAGEDASSSGPPRRTWRITAHGRARAADETRRLAGLVRQAGEAGLVR